MTRVTIFGSGITGMAIASRLPRHYDVTVVARDLPGDPPSQGWASPWACAGWAALGGSPLEEDMQLDALAHYRRLARSHLPEECGVVCTEMTEVLDRDALGCPDSLDDHWAAGRLDGLEGIPAQSAGVSAPETIKLALRYPSVVVDPSVFLPWLRGRLEASGVRFERIPAVSALSELSPDRFGHDILVNASGRAPAELGDVNDDKVTLDRTYTILVRSGYRGSFVRRGTPQYTYVFGRGDGTAVIGGISVPVADPILPRDDVRRDLIRRAHENLPAHFPSADPDDYEIIDDLAGVRPLRLPGVRIEKEVLGGQRVVHAYGTTNGGYMFGFGLGREAARLVDEFPFE